MATSLTPRVEVRIAVSELRRVVERLEELLETGTRKLVAAEELAKLEQLDGDAEHALRGFDLGDERVAELLKMVELLGDEFERLNTWNLLRATEAAGRLFNDLSLYEHELAQREEL